MGLREFVADPRFQSKDIATQRAMLADYGVAPEDMAPLLGSKIAAAPAAPPEKSAMDWVMGGPEAQLSGVDKGVYQAFKGAATFPFEVAKQQVQAAVQGDPSALIPGGPAAKAEAERVVGEGAGAIQSAKQGDILAALHQALSAIPGIGGMYKDAATDVIQGNPDVGAGKVLGNVMAARVAPDVVPPTAATAGKGIEKVAGAVKTATPYIKTAAKEAGPIAAGAAVDVAMGGMGTVGGLLGQAFKAAKKSVDRARISKLEREVAEIDKITAAQTSEEIAGIRRAEAEAIAREKANTRLIDQIDKQQNGEWLINQRKTAAELKAAEKARDAEIRKLESDIRKGQQAEDLEGAYGRIAEAQAYVDSQSKLLKAYQTEEYQQFMEAGRASAAADKAARTAQGAERKSMASKAEKARIELERTKTRLIDKITKAQEKEAAAATPAAPTPKVNLREAFEGAAPEVAVAPVAKSVLEKATSLSNTLGKKGYDAAAIEAQLRKSHPTLEPEMAKKLASSAPKPEALGYQDAALAQADKGWTVTEIATKLVNQEGLTQNQALKAAYDSVVSRVKMTPEQAAEVAQIRGKNLKKVRLEDIKPSRKPPVEPLATSPKPKP